MTLLGDPFAGFVIAGLSLGVVGGVGVGWGSVCLAAALRRPGLRWLTGSGDPALKLAGPVRCIRCKRSVCPACRRVM